MTDRPLEITVSHRRLVVAGEIDASTASTLADALAAADPSELDLDLGAVDFIDSGGLAVLITAHQHRMARGNKLCIVNPSPAVTRLIELSGLCDYFDVAD
jgi:anti-sigma B factor antagonist